VHLEIPKIYGQTIHQNDWKHSMVDFELMVQLRMERRARELERKINDTTEVKQGRHVIYPACKLLRIESEKEKSEETL